MKTRPFLPPPTDSGHRPSSGGIFRPSRMPSRDTGVGHLNREHGDAHTVPGGFLVPTDPSRKTKPKLPCPAQTAPAHRSEAGFLLLDSAQGPIYANAEALQILAYPAHPGNVTVRKLVLPDRIRAILPRQPNNGAPQPDSKIEFLSGRRHYLCRAFYFPARSNGASQANTALVLERNVQEHLDASEVAKQFGLTRREQETVEMVMHGLTSKEIACRMSISLNTVKAFLKLAMLKMGVTSRSEIVEKIHAQAVRP